MISRTGIHATLALSFLAQLRSGEYAGAAKIAREVGAPQNYLGKLLKQLAELGLLESQKGFGGGFRLARKSVRITLYDILEPVERVSKWNGCFMGRSRCDENSPCALHDRWSRIRDEYMGFLKATTLADVANGDAKVQKKPVRHRRRT
ncbi:MAG: Rrf2 family transcriptional regulator [Candidatus Zixiibacteriota bacterium]